MRKLKLSTNQNPLCSVTTVAATNTTSKSKNILIEQGVKTGTSSMDELMKIKLQKLQETWGKQTTQRDSDA